ncbi:hypothetical protein HCN44_004707 [Aphidius gifuensis]|uniref:Sodium channel protein Nach n=1 Tax=Aphidius gifuensis TaxID=684658 RepID=A0A834XXB0_APHGI|nr:hypothetical protein HCN44_004707 [Aphidius gifuensis]
MNKTQFKSFNVKPRKKIKNHVASTLFHGVVKKNNDTLNVKTTLFEVYKEFVNESSIHGIKYISLAKTRLERIFWIFVLVVSILSAVLLANQFYTRHQEANMRTLVIDNQYPAWKIPIPAITICHPNIVSRSRVQDFLSSNKNFTLPDGLTMNDFMDSLKQLRNVYHPTIKNQMKLKNLHDILVVNNISLKEFMSIASPQCEDFIVACRYEGKMKNCKTLIKRSLITTGYCCSFNYHYNNDPSRQFVQPDIYSFNYGERFIISIMAKGLHQDDRITSDYLGDGFKIIIHNKYSYPGTLSQEFITSMNIEVITRLYARRLTASKNVLDSPVQERKCFKNLNKNIPYKMENCLIKCREKVQKEECGCLPFYASTIYSNDTICTLLDIPCLAKIKIKVLTLNPDSCGCYPDCEEDTFTVDTTSLSMDVTQLNPSAFYQASKNYTHATAIHITFSEQTCMLQRREIVLSWINLVSSLGGVFSLFLGCSFISLFEMIYFFGYFIWKISRKKKGKKK